MGELDQAKKSLYNYHQIWKQYGFVPEFYDIANNKLHKRDGYPLRPEFIESVFYLYQATKDPHLLIIGTDVVDSIYYSARTECGYATVKSIYDHTIEDRMESFFLAETLKYLYLLFDEDNFMHNKGNHGTIRKHRQPNLSQEQTCVIGSGGYVFNTEAHPIDIAALSCCSKHIPNEDDSEQNLFDLIPLKKMSNCDLDKLLQQPLENPFIDVSNIPKETEPILPTSMVTEHFTHFTVTDQVDICSKDNCDISLTTTDQIQPSFTQIPSMANTLGNDLTQEIIANEPHKIESTSASSHSSSSFSDTNFEDSTVPLSSVNQATINTSDKDSEFITELLQSKFFTLSNVTTVDLHEYYRSLRLLAHQVEQLQEITLAQSNNYELLSCPSQPFLMRLSLYGQMFV